MKKIITLLFAITLSPLVHAQSGIQKEIDQSLWKPFQKAFETLDATSLNSLYANNVLRVTPNGIDTKDAFKAGNVDRFNTSKKNNVSIRLDFWFDSRHTQKDTSYEVGFYRITSISNGNSSYSYGQFHIVLKKIKGKWKITQDWDTTTINGKRIGKSDFEKNSPLKF